jgi:uncharacterized membrane-anchored protein YitT (DUF2179 family)
MQQALFRYFTRLFFRSRDPETSAYEFAKQMRRLRIRILNLVRNVLFIALGILSASFGLKSFLLPNGFIDGGATGIALLLTEITGLPLPAILFCVNIPFVLLGYRVIGKQFAITTAIAISVLALVIATASFPIITHEKILVAIFGGFFLGAGIGLAVRGGSVIDGTEVLALFLSKKSASTVGDIITLVNILIFSAAAYFLSIETAMYSMITYLAASKTVDFLIEGIEEYTGITIISPRSEEIREMLIHKLGRGVTIYHGKRGYGKTGHNTEVEIIYTVITRLEISKLTSEIELIDPNAFVVMTSIKDTRGGMVKKRPLSH